MQGNVDMDGHRIRNLPSPEAGDESVRLIDYVTYILPYLYHQGARVYHSANQSIPNITLTNLTFDSETYDTDNIHDPVTNNGRLTCRTAGKYLAVLDVAFSASNVGERTLIIMKSPFLAIGYTRLEATGNWPWVCSVSTIHQLAVDDYIYAQVYQTSGGALNVLAVSYYSARFMMQRIG
ncbi:unnamed protein product [marine sediment metagenome]|uniref:Uncharacterized protein n=1 Tax=marine sediment metagenome TaxID=412755 RepID=X1QHJ3_9ZZZZ